MDDLRARVGDRPEARSGRNAWSKSARGDRAKPRPDLLLLLALCGCATLAPVEPRAAVETWWVDAHAPLGGDGSPARPWKVLPAQLPPGSWVHLSSGLYRGPVVLPAGARLTGHGTAVVFLDEPGVVVAATDARLEHLSIQGGTVGLEARGQVQVDDVHFSGHRGSAVLVEGAARARLDALEVVGSTGEDGVRVVGGELELRRSRFSGALRRAVWVERGAASLVDVSSLGAQSLLHAIGARVVVQDATAEGGRGPGLFASAGSLRVRGLSVVGHEYGLLAVRAALDAQDLTTRASQLSGVALDRCTGRLSGLVVERAGTLGGVQLLGSEVTVEDARVSDGAALGILVRHGVVKLGRVRVDTVRAEGSVEGQPVLGDGLAVRDAVVTLERLEVRDVEGTGLFVSAAASVEAAHVEVERAAAGAVVVERGSTLRLGRLVSRGARGPSLLVTDGARAFVSALEASGREVPVWAECAEGARVFLGDLTWAGELPPSGCVEPLPQ